MPVAVVYGRSASCDDVAPAQLERVDAELAGDGRSSARGRRSRSSTGRGRARARTCWCRRPGPRTPIRGIRYGPGKSIADEADGAAAGGRERADVLDEARPCAPRMWPSASSARLIVMPVVAGVLAGHQVLAPVLDPLHRPAEAPAGEHDGELLGDHEHLLAEPAADVAHDHAHLVLGQAEDPGQESRARRAGPGSRSSTSSSSRTRVPARRRCRGSPSARTGSGAGRTSR